MRERALFGGVSDLIGAVWMCAVGLGAFCVSVGTLRWSDALCSGSEGRTGPRFSPLISCCFTSVRLAARTHLYLCQLGCVLCIVLCVWVGDGVEEEKGGIIECTSVGVPL